MKIKELIFMCEHGSAQQRINAIVDLQEMGAKEAVPIILNLLNFPDPDVRANAACALGELGNKDIGKALLPLLVDSSSLVRIKAAESLGLLRYVDGFHSLEIALSTDRDPLVRIHAAQALGMLKKTSVLPALIKALDDADEGVRGYAADAIGNLGDVEAISNLKQKNKFEHSLFAKAFILSALYRLGEKDSLALLVNLSKSAEDVLAVTILNLAFELATCENAETLKTLIIKATQSREALNIEVRSLIERLNSI